MLNQVVLVGKVTRHDIMTTYLKIGATNEEIPIYHEKLSDTMQDRLRELKEETTVGIKGHLVKENDNIQVQPTKIAFIGEEEGKETWS